jgi:hypothetical protein
MDSRINQALERFSKTQSVTTKRPAPKSTTQEKAGELSLEQLLRLFLGPARLLRAEEMDDSLVTVSSSTPEHISGKVKEYVVDIDMSKRVILHDCQDWKKNLDSKTMCKHLGKFLLTIDEAEATELLRNVLSNMDRWTFTAPDNQR